ncbi:MULTISPECIES: heavy metal translocating P-type ATPase [unclassified Sporosarcina]|uniref:heavy metal translocating P-type ATPase n=1 Tax=unclassified Sporosarcina TaxID=2647733 RepID=UPI000C16BB4D|nr:MULTISPECIES: heavy metal translocating P-type ATPase [unclassified Sporosarcina]PID04747.1 heavy metal translocating P-type ATPase [Sporosarcina sp. P30]PID07901.1 heavy metal translocating P-type ATPase [Sporosarcina sp. P31]PID11087.1 heavy metal translocating P-type ATPase [Sporosarcina sp. P32b]
MTTLAKEQPQQTIDWSARLELIAAILSGIIILAAWILGKNGTESFSVTLYIIAFLIGGYAKAKEGIEETIKNKELNVEMLMIFAAIGSGIIGYWAEGAILIFIFAISGALETYTLNKSHNEISSLMELQPEEAWLILEDGSEKKVSTDSLSIGAILLVKPGERIPVDGEILSGITSIDMSAINGESIPVTKQENDELFAGTVNISGAIRMTMTKPSSETLFQKIITMVQNAQSEKSPSQQFIERFEGSYVKIVLAAVVIMMFLPHFLFNWDWTTTFYRAIVLLVVASPCALMASIMPATLAAVSNGARKGVLFKGGVHLEHLSTLQAFAFDKTGTLTNGKPIVMDFIVREGADVEETLALFAGAESLSNHPLAKAIINYATEHGVEPKRNLHIEDVPGFGIKAETDQGYMLIGKPKFVGEELVEEFQDNVAVSLANEGKTVIFMRDEQGIVALAALQDTLRKEAISAIKSLQSLGLHTVMLTGDNEKTAQAIANEVGMDSYVAECLPEEKVIQLKQLLKKYGMVGMVGDGINDAPALATATSGIAMGEGTDVALETADVVLMQNDLNRLSYAIKLSRKMQRIVKQNVFFSIAVISILIIANFMQVVDLPLGVIGHEGSTILVILNGLRMLNKIE